MSFIKDKILRKKSDDEEDGHQLSLVNVSQTIIIPLNILLFWRFLSTLQTSNQTSLKKKPCYNYLQL